MAKKKKTTKKKATKKTSKKPAMKVAKKKKKAGKRTVLRSSKGKKLYAVRDAEGQFKDIQSYARAHAQDIKRDAADEA